MNVTFDQSDLRPLIELVVATTLERLEADRQKAGKRLAYSEPEAAALLGVRPHVLRDARLRGELAGSRVGKRILYEHGELLRFLQKRRNI